MRACLASGPLSRREQQIVNLAVARHWNARYPWFAQVRGSLAVGIDQAVIDAINAHGTPDLADARERTCFVVARELLANKGLSDETYAAAEKTMGLEALVALVASIGSFSMTCMTGKHLRDRAAGRQPDAAQGIAQSASAPHSVSAKKSRISM